MVKSSLQGSGAIQWHVVEVISLTKRTLRGNIAWQTSVGDYEMWFPPAEVTELQHNRSCCVIITQRDKSNNMHAFMSTEMTHTSASDIVTVQRWIDKDISGQWIRRGTRWCRERGNKLQKIRSNFLLYAMSRWSIACNLSPTRGRMRSQNSS